MQQQRATTTTTTTDHADMTNIARCSNHCNLREAGPTIHPTNLALTQVAVIADLWTLCLSCFPSFNWCKHSTCTGGGCHQLQLALVVLFHSATSADSPLAHVVASPSATCTGGTFSSRHWRKYCTCTHPTCTVWWWWSVEVIYIYIHHGDCATIGT